MEVYILEYNQGYDTVERIAVFATRELAEKHRTDLGRPYLDIVVVDVLQELPKVVTLFFAVCEVMQDGRILRRKVESENIYEYQLYTFEYFPVPYSDVSFNTLMNRWFVSSKGLNKDAVCKELDSLAEKKSAELRKRTYIQEAV